MGASDPCERIAAGETPLRAWREHLGLELTDLRRETGISVMVLDRLDRGLRAPTKAEAVKIGRAMDIHSHNLLPHSLAGCSDLDVDEDEILARERE